MAMTRYERTKAFRKSHPAYRRHERLKHYAKHDYGEQHRHRPYTHEEVEMVLTKQWHGKEVVDHVIAKKLRRSLKAVHVYRSILLHSTRVPRRWKVLVHVLQKEGRIWQKT